MSTIYWHIQMNQPYGRGSIKIDSVKMLKEPQPIIGTGEWNDIQCKYFKGTHKNGLKIGDIILVHEGKKPIALCTITSNSFIDKTLQKKYIHGNFRYVKVLDFYKEKDTFKDNQGTLSRLIDSRTDSWKFIDIWYKKIVKKMKTENVIKLLKQKKQIILQGPPGTGKTRLAKELASLLCNANDDPKSTVEFSDKYIQSKLKNISIINSATQRTKYKIDNVENKKCKVTLLSTGTSYDISYNGIRKAITDKLWEKGEQKGGFDPYNAAIAKYLFENKDVKTSDKINAFFKNFKVDETIKLNRESIKEINNEFLAKFPKNTIINLSKERYAVGHDDMDGFCYWLEYKLTETGKYTGTAINRKLYWSSDQEKYIKSGFVKEIEDDDEAMQKISQLLHNIINEKDEKGKYEIGKGFVLKILNTYKPNVYFPINNEAMLNNALKLFGVNGDTLNYLEKNKELQKLFLQKKEEFNADVENYEFMRYLFDNFNNLKGDFNQIKTMVFKGESKLIQFHPSYTYEDFVRGITVKSIDNKVIYKTENRILAQMANDAVNNPLKNYVLIIDEINRANLSSVLGELIYALEYRYYFKKDNLKEATVESMYDLSEDDLKTDKDIVLPENLYIIGTMNTADRSVGQIDYAIRRRFAFVNVLPKVLDETTLEEGLKFHKEMFHKVKTLFDDGENKYLSEEFNAKDVQLGHSYFIYKEGEFDLKLNYEILPILREYVTDGILKEEALEIIDNLK